jgi:seryl-tRNA synthetase
VGVRVRVRQMIVGGGRAFHFNFKDLVKNVESVEQNCKDRGLKDVDVRRIVELYQKEKTIVQSMSMVKAEQRLAEKKPNNREECLSLKEKHKKLTAELEDIEVHLSRLAKSIPNNTHPSSPRGDVPREIRRAGGRPPTDEQKTFPPKSHLELASGRMFDFEAGSKVCGSKFYYSRGASAFLELALTNWALHFVASRGYTPYITPDVATASMVEACGFEPRGDASQIYGIDGNEMCLVGTSEITLGGIHSDTIFEYPEKQLPIRMAGVSHCFRRETGHAGIGVKGIYRVHQFTKVEMFTICLPSESEKEFDRIVKIQEEMYGESLNLRYRVLDINTTDLGNPAYRKYDIEAWMPSRGDFGEISSTSNCTDYQARRLSLRYRPGPNQPVEYLHTLNGTALAVPRVMMALLENNQVNSSGLVVLPEALSPFLNGFNGIDHTGALVKVN